MSRKATWVIILSLIAVLYVYVNDWASDVDETPVSQVESPSEIPIAIDATALHEEYDDNEVRADNLYKDKVLRIAGTVESVGKGILDRAYVSLDSGSQVFVVQCFFDETRQNDLARLSKGDRVRVVGRCKGKRGNIVVKNCRLW